MVWFRDLDLNNVFSLTYFIAFATIADLGPPVNMNTHAKCMH
jgi:hypothetical protein